MECCSLLANIVLQASIEALTGSMSILLSRKSFGIKRCLYKCIFAWKLLNKRTPTKDNLHRRGVLHLGSLLCVEDSGKRETINLMFLECDLFWGVWLSILLWLEIFSVQHSLVS